MSHTDFSLHQLQAQVARIADSLINEDINGALENLYLFSEQLRAHFPGKKLEDFLKDSDFKSLGMNVAYKDSEFGSILFCAITEIKFIFAEEMETDTYLRKLVANTEAAILCFYNVMKLNPNDIVPEDEVVFQQYLPKLKIYIEQKHKTEILKEKYILIKQMTDISKECKRLEKQAEGPAAKAMLNKMVEGLSKINEKYAAGKIPETLEKIKSEYASVIVNASQKINLEKPENTSKKDIDIIRQAKKLIIKAVNVIKSGFYSIRPLRILFAHAETRLKRADSKADKQAAEQYAKIQNMLTETNKLVGRPG